MTTDPRNRMLLTGGVLIAANLIPIYGVLFRDWDVFPLLMLFWFENVSVGVWNVFRMLSAAGPDRPGLIQRLGLSLFFSVHYGGFAVGHGLFIVALFGPEAARQGLSLDPSALLETWMIFSAVGLFVSHGVSYFANFIGAEERKKLTLNQLMHKPYSRVVLLHVALMGGGFLVQMLGSPLAALLLLVLLKIVVDLRAHRREHAKLLSGADHSVATS